MILKWIRKRIVKTIFKIAISIILGIALIFVVAIGGLNIAKFAIYSDYYDIEDEVCENPGLGDGFVCQGIAAAEKEGKILVSGYMKDGDASRIYITDLEDNSHFVTLTKGGEPFDGHAGGIATTDDTVYLANSSRLYTFSLTALLACKEGGEMEIGEGVEVNNHASFVYSDEEFVYVGEFNGAGNYKTEHPYDTKDGTYNAIITKYSVDDLTSPLKIYSIRDKVQGACFTPDGKVVLSTSYGLADSIYYVYNESEATDSGLMLDGAPVYYLDKCEREIKGPAMGEDLDYSNGKVITLTESASDKYIFGKLFFANDIVSLDFE